MIVSHTTRRLPTAGVLDSRALLTAAGGALRVLFPATCFVLLAAAFAPATAGAQQMRPQARLEARLDAFAGSMDALHAGGGFALPLGNYVRMAALAGAGVARTRDESGFSARAEVLGRFQFDPIRQHRWGPYASAGVSVRTDLESCCRGHLALLLGAEGPTIAGRSLFLEAGLGGGVRLAVGLRGSAQRFR
ncbi:MAG TPA: hypothetical protein VMM18_01435 [Gemmatimonadaceae bacterium]|nr:hypothetical protein [Gemmatimonadaceae bacterium]